MTENKGNTPYQESLKESLSALMDGEASELEVRRVLTETGESVDLQKTWSRYHLASQTMRGEKISASIDLSSSISELIADEPNHGQSSAASGSSVNKGLLGQVGRVAIAASVAVVAVFAVNQFNADNSGNVAEIAETTVPAEPAPAASSPSVNDLPIGYGTSGLSARTVSSDGVSLEQRRNSAPVVFVPRSEVQISDPAVEEFLRSLLAEHAAVGAGAEGSLPFERVPRIEVQK